MNIANIINLSRLSSEDNIIQITKDELQKAREKMKHVNIIIAGKTGVGKSSLINAVFGEELTSTGIGAPITKEIQEITKDGIPVRIYDTVGLELGNKQQKQTENDIIKLIKEKQNKDIDQMIHCIWYCINSNSNRIEDEEIKLINELSDQFKDIPIILILTQSYGPNVKKLKEYIEKQNLHIYKLFCVLANDYCFDDNYCKSKFGIDELVNSTKEIIAEEVQKAFIAAQKVSLKMKRDKAQMIIATTSATAFGTGFIPLPFSDAMALVPIQIGMIAKITTIYGMNLKQSTMRAIITSLLGSVSLTAAGKTIVSNLLKLIPGVGTAAGGVISGTTAAVLSGALGETYILIMEQLARGEIVERDLMGSKAKKKFQDIFKEKLLNPSKNYKDIGIDKQ